MKNLIIITILIFQTSFAFALDFNDYLNKAKSRIESLMGKKADTVNVTTDVIFPKIPKIIRDAKSLKVYEKKGKVYTQGHAFNKMRVEQKRKYRLAFIQELYFVVNGAHGDKSNVLSSLNVLENGGAREGIYRSIVLSNDYASLEGFSENPTDKLLGFSSRFGKKFLNRDFNTALMKQLNLYGIKKVITEKTLELVDAFPKDGEALYRWYAVFSSDIVIEFPILFKGQTRSQSSALYHLAWAKSVPLQHIKSELIIKIHKIMNSLQK
jgi:hypothetical protein